MSDHRVVDEGFMIVAKFRGTEGILYKYFGINVTNFLQILRGFQAVLELYRGNTFIIVGVGVEHLELSKFNLFLRAKVQIKRSSIGSD